MSDYAWFVLENIALYAVAAACLFLLPGWWKMMAFAFLAFVNTSFRRKRSSGGQHEQ